MKIGFDIQSTLGKITGIPRYTLNLMDALARLENPPELYQFQNGVRRDLRTYERFWWEAVDLPSQFAKSPVDAIHVPGFGIRKSGKKKVIITAHDIIGYLFPQNLSLTARLYWGNWLARCFRQADHLICNSHHTKGDLIQYLQIPEQKISVIYIDADPNCRAIPVEEAGNKVAQSLGVKEPYFLFVGTIEPRKNLVRTLKAYSEALKRKSDLPKLLVVGAKEWGTEMFEKALIDFKLRNQVITTGYVPDELLWNIYSAAHAVIFVSLYEGFGLPLVEAVKCHVPVLASNNSSLGELGNDCAYLVDPYSEEEIARGIYELGTNPGLIKELKEKGIHKSNTFSWSKTARETAEVYKKFA